MKRPLKRIKYEGPRPHLDPRDDFSSEQLSLIGAIAVAYNYLEYSHRGLLNVTLPVPPGLYGDVATRINGFDGIQEIVKKAIVLDGRLNPHAPDIGDTLAASKTCKTYRDALIHVMVQKSSPGVGWLVGKRGKLEEVLLTEEALSNVLQFIISTTAELVSLLLVCIRKDVVDLNRFSAEERRLLESEFPVRLAQYQQHQNSRRSLPPLPKFPDEPQAPQETANSPSPQQ